MNSPTASAPDGAIFLLLGEPICIVFLAALSSDTASWKPTLLTVTVGMFYTPRGRAAIKTKLLQFRSE